FQLMCLCAYFREGGLEFFGGQGDPVPLPAQGGGAGCFNMGAEPLLVQGLAEGVQVVQQRFTTGNNGNAAGMLRCCSGQLRYRQYRVPGCIPAVLYIAPVAANIASAQAYKIRSLPLVAA